jgi:hypothetical protein
LVARFLAVFFAGFFFAFDFIALAMFALFLFLSHVRISSNLRTLNNSAAFVDSE